MLSVLVASGDPVVASDLRKIFKSFIQPGVLTGFDLYVSSNNKVGITAGAAITEEGVFILEDEVSILNIEQTVAAKNYTIVYKYVTSSDFGGEKPSLQLMNGLLPQDDSFNGVILGWIKYAGGSAPLTSNMLSPSTKISLGKPLPARKDNFDNVLAPLANKWIKKTSSNSNIVSNDYYDTSLNAIVSQLVNTGATLSTAEYLVPFAVPSLGAGQLMVDFSVSSAGSVNVDILTESGDVVVPATNVPMFTNRAMAKEILAIPKHAEIVFGKIIYVRFKVILQPTHEMKIKRLGISSYTEPV